MNLSIVLVLMLVMAIAFAKPMSDEEVQAWKTIIGNCVATEGANEQELANMMMMAVPTTHPEMCLHACIMESTGLIVDGKFNAPNAITAAKHVNNNNAKKMEIITIVSQDCADKTPVDPDRCVYAKNIVECNDKAALALGMSQKDMLSP